MKTKIQCSTKKVPIIFDNFYGYSIRKEVNEGEQLKLHIGGDCDYCWGEGGLRFHFAMIGVKTD